MNDRPEKSLKEKLADARGVKFYREFLSQIPSITLLDFQEGFRPFSGCRLISKIWLEPSDDEVIEWIVSTLKEQEIQGEYLLQFRTPSAQNFGLWARVKLSPTYEWVKPLWLQGHGLQFLSLDFNRILEFYPEDVHYWAMLCSREESTDEG